MTAHHAATSARSTLAIVASATATSFTLSPAWLCTFASTIVSRRPGFTTEAVQASRSPSAGATMFSLYSAVRQVCVVAVDHGARGRRGRIVDQERDDAAMKEAVLLQQLGALLSPTSRLVPRTTSSTLAPM